jgi:YHS domain-containing protein
MIRFLILLGIGYFGYKLVKNWVSDNMSKIVTTHSANQIDDIMVKDPYCQVYFPKREGFHLKVDGEDLYFCSEECRDNFLASREENSK